MKKLVTSINNRTLFNTIKVLKVLLDGGCMWAWKYWYCHWLISIAELPFVYCDNIVWTIAPLGGVYRISVSDITDKTMMNHNIRRLLYSLRLKIKMKRYYVFNKASDSIVTICNKVFILKHTDIFIFAVLIWNSAYLYYLWCIWYVL